MKLTDWVQQLDALIEQRRHEPHAYGINDCCMFAADAIKAQTGEDMAKKFRGKYSNQRGAEKILKRYGGLEGLVTEFLGEPRGPNNAMRGDLVLFKSPNGDAIGVCVDAQHFVCPGDTELVFFPLRDAIKSWRVG